MSGTDHTSIEKHAALRRVLLTAVAAAASGAVFALEALRTSGDQRYFVISARRGETVRRAVRVVNTGDRSGTVLLYPSDAGTGRTTGAVYRAKGDPRRGVGAWTRLGASRLRLAPGESRTVPITVRVPRGARDGQHLGGVTAETVELSRGTTRRRGAGRFRVDVRSLTIVAIQITVPGAPVERLAVSGARAGKAGASQAVLVGLHNSGNQLLKGSGQLTIRDESGRRVKDVKFPIDTFVPRTQIANPIVLAGRALPQGDYRATVALRYGHGRQTQRTVPFSVSRRQLEQVFGARQTAAPAAQDSEPPILWLAIGGVALLLGGFLGAAILFGRRDAAAARRERDLDHPGVR